MQITLFKALQSIKIEDDAATAVVDQLERHIDIMVGQANKGLEGKLDGLKTTVEATRPEITTTRSSMTLWFTIQSTLLALFGAAALWLGYIKPYLG